MSHDSEQDQRSALQHEAEHASPGKKNSVLIYLVILFAAAFLLLLLSYFMQQRASREAYSSLQQSSNSAVQSLDNMLQENEDLKEQVAQLEQELADAQNQLDGLPDIISHQEQVLEQTCQALDYFWQINEAYVRGRYSLCRELIAAMEDNANGKTPLKDYLPTESTTNTDRFSPAERYQEIYSAVM